MLSLNLIVRAVIMHEGRFLVTAINDGERPLFYTLIGGHPKLDESLLRCVQREVQEEVNLLVVPSKLLYIVENFFSRGARKLHEIGYYFLCHLSGEITGSLMDAVDPNLLEEISPELMSPDELENSNFQPELLRHALVTDSRENFVRCPQLMIINELPGDVETPSGVYQL